MRASRGLTLIELLVGIAVLAVLLRVAVPAFNTMIQNAQIRAVAESLQSGLTTARNEAVQRNRVVRFTRDGTGWSVCERDDGATACANVIQARPPAEAGGTGQVASVLRPIASGADVAYDGTLSFNGLGRTTTTFLPAGNNAVYLVSHPSAACRAADGPLRCLNVVVNAAGQVRMCDPSPGLPTDDPRRC